MHEFLYYFLLSYNEYSHYIECLDVDYTSKRRETFYDIQLNIKSEKGNDLQTIEESMKEFTADEMLDGDNLYEAEGYGKQRCLPPRGWQWRIIDRPVLLLERFE